MNFPIETAAAFPSRTVAAFSLATILVNKQGDKLYKSLSLGTICRSFADQFSEDQIFSGQGFDLIFGAIRHHFRSYLEAEPKVQAEIALYQSARSPKGTGITRVESATSFVRWRVVSKSIFHPN